MLVVLMLKDKLLKLELPNKISGNYAIKDNDKNYINIESNNGSWVIKSNRNVKIVKNKNEIYTEVQLQIGSFYSLSFFKTGEFGFIYVSPIYDNSFVQYNINNTNSIVISNNSSSEIYYKTGIINGQQFKIFSDKKTMFFESINNSVAYINNEIVRQQTKLKNGDIIFIYGLKIIFVANTLFVNNPSNSVFTNDKLIPIKKEKSVPLIDDEDELDYYDDTLDFFLRAPSIKNVIEKQTIVVDAPPTLEKPDDTPIAYVVGPMLSMGMISMVTLISSLNSFSSGKKTFSEIIPSLVIALAMFSGILIWPILNRRYQNKKKKKRERKRQDKYGDYIEKKSQFIDQIIIEQRKILNENYPDAKSCENIVLKKSSRLFERRIDNDDFLRVRLGIGSLPLDIDIKYPEEHFTMEEDNLIEILNKLVNKSKIIDSVPITFSFALKNISAIVDESGRIYKSNYIQNLLLQLTTFHSYEDLKLVFLLDDNSNIDMNYIKMLPHVWNNSKTFRFVANNIDDMKDVSLYLEEILQNRLIKDGKFSVSDAKYTDFDNYYLIITDDYKKAANLQIITDLLQIKNNVGFSLLFLTDSINNLPNECTDFIDLKDDECTIFASELSSKQQKKFVIEDYNLEVFQDVTKVLNNIKIKSSKNNFILPTSYDFLEMYKVSNIEQLNVFNRWKNNDSTLSLKALLGIDENGEEIYLDLHEKAHGPHGLVAGMTGSGKSELIITFILSVALNYHPDDVNFILIDYKGGSLAGVFQNKQSGIKLPHLVGTITNLDTIEMNRSLSSIQSELNRRQKVFNEARSRLDEGTIDIYKYQKLYHDGVVSEPIPHLIIISDEFVELKTQQPDFMEQLIRVARIGRSLGVHLILATQKPSGIVNEQIRSNSRFSICLKVQDKSDSMDMINRPDAASLKQAGRFYLQIGYNEYFVLGQAAWSGAPYIPSDKPIKKVDTSIAFISNLGKKVKEVNNIKPMALNSKGEQVNNIIKYLSDIAGSEKIISKQLWLDKIPELIYLNELREKYNYQYYVNDINPIIGEYDAPLNQKQEILTLPISKEGNIIIFGSADSGKEILLSTMIYDLITTHHTNEMNIYVFDFGSETLKKYMKAPQVGDVITLDNQEKVTNFFYMIQKEIERRKKIVSDSDNLKALDAMPMILIIINNYEVFKENYEKYDDLLLTITRDSIKYKINFILTASASNQIRYRLQQNFKLKLALQLNDESDYNNILINARKIKPSHIIGRGLININDDVYEFQTANICKEEDINNYLNYTFDYLVKQERSRAKMVPILPDIVKTAHIVKYMKGLAYVPIGVTETDLKVETYDFKNNFITFLTGKRLDLLQQFGYNLFNMISTMNDINIEIIDKHNSYKNMNIRFRTNLTNTKLTYLPYKHNLYCFIGIDSLKKYVEYNKNNVEKVFESLTGINNSSIIVVDSVQQIKSVEFENWYKQYVVNSDGIWIGNGISEQFIIKTNVSVNKLNNNCGDNFGYIIKKGMPKLVKLLEMSDNNDE